MKKKMIIRGIQGLPLGIAIGYVITILLSVIWGEGYYSPCVPELENVAGGEIQAVILQAALCGLLGAVFGAASVIWDVEEWSIVRQTGTYFVIVCAAMMPMAYILRWMEHSMAGFVQYFVVFIIVFIVVWVSKYLIMKRKIQAINNKLQ